MTLLKSLLQRVNEEATASTAELLDSIIKKLGARHVKEANKEAGSLATRGYTNSNHLSCQCEYCIATLEYATTKILIHKMGKSADLIDDKVRWRHDLEAPDYYAVQSVHALNANLQKKHRMALVDNILE